MRVAFLLSGLHPAGLEIYLLRFLSFCRSQSEDINYTIICRGNAASFAGRLNSEFRQIGVELIHFPMKHSSATGYLRLFYLFKKARFNSVIDFSGCLAGPTILIAYLAGVDIRITSYRESRYQFKENVIKQLFMLVSKKIISLLSTRVISNSQAAFHYFHPNELSNPKFKVIKNSIVKPDVVSNSACRAFMSKYKIPEGAFVVGHVGRFTPAKNHENICKVIEAINLKDPSVFFLLCGRGVRSGVEQFSKEIHNVGYIDHLDDLSAFFACIDLFYFPSLNEGQPNALLEAMAANVPVVASNIPPIIDSVPALPVSFLVNPEDINSCVEKLLDMRRGNANYPLTVVSMFVNDAYASDLNFERFRDVILGC